MKAILITLLLGTFFSVNAIIVTSVVPHSSDEPEDAVAMDASELLSDFVGDGFTITSASYSPAETDPDYSSIGLYTEAVVESQGNQSLLNGIVLSTGYVTMLNSNENTNDYLTGEIASSGDSDLDALLEPTYMTDDATYIEFEFTVDSDVDQLVSFTYMFGSDEYDEWANSDYNDIFAIFYDGENIATIPDTDIPVSINTINNEVNSELYTSNDLDNPEGAQFATEIDGFTSPLTAQFTAEAGSTHQLKIAIADVGLAPLGDHIQDSWIFIGMDSWESTSTSSSPSCPPHHGHHGHHHPQSVPEPCTANLLFISLFFVLSTILLKRRNPS